LERNNSKDLLIKRGTKQINGSDPFIYENSKTYSDGQLNTPKYHSTNGNINKKAHSAVNSVASTPDRGKHARFISWENTGKRKDGLSQKYTVRINSNSKESKSGLENKYHLSTFYCPHKNNDELPPIDGRRKTAMNFAPKATPIPKKKVVPNLIKNQY